MAVALRTAPKRQLRLDDQAATAALARRLAPLLRRGDVLAVAFLPPREVGGSVSEAMYLGSESRSEAPGTVLAEEAVDAREAASILHDELHKR